MKKLVLISSIVLILLTLFTHYYGSIDIGDYADSAKYLTGEYSAKIRVAHSFLYGLIHVPFLSLMHNFLIFKLTSLLFLFLIIYSIYIISNNKNAFLLSILSPIVWYMAPWINPIQLASLLLLWAYFFIEKYDKTNKVYNLFLSGILIGLGIGIWNTLIYIGGALFFVFLFDKKFNQVIVGFISILIGLLPLFIVDYILFNFPFYTLLKTSSSQFLFIFLKQSIYSSNLSSSFRFLDILLIILYLPFYFWLIYKPSFFKTNKKSVIFVSLSLIIILLNPQIRYSLIIFPIITILILKVISKDQIKKYLIFSGILLLITVIPYLVQINYQINDSLSGFEIRELIVNSNNLTLSSTFNDNLLSQDLNLISNEYPNQTFLVGNQPDDYQLLAHYYWGNNINEFVSIQDYNLWLSNSSILFQKKFMPIPHIPDRRQIWIIGGMSKNEEDNTDYKNIQYALSINAPINSNNFTTIKKYNILYLSKKI